MSRAINLRGAAARLSALGAVARAAVLILPAGLLALAALRAPEGNRMMLWLGTGLQGGCCLLTLSNRRGWRQSIGPTVITLYLVALAWLWWGDGRDDWYTHLSKSVLLVVPLAVFAHQTLTESGAPAIRRARGLADRLAERKEWPTDLAACRQLPEVKALRAALAMDAAPALALLHHPRPEVRVAALSALEFRKDWRRGQAELVLQTAQHAEQPIVRAAAVSALANMDDPHLIEAVAQFLHDPSWEVRRAATESLLWDTAQRWSWIRYTVRRVLADPLYQNDGALCPSGVLLSPEAVNDLTGWCAEKGVLAIRAALTLAVHYTRALTEQPDGALVESLRRQLASPPTPAVLRIELGRVLQTHQELDPPLLEKLLAPSNPAPLRLTAVETLLADHTEGPLHAMALATLRDLARLPNREIALATADVIQRRLGVDLGLGLGQPLPPIHSRQAAEVTRRVMRWAVQFDAQEDTEDSRIIAQRG
ncbi:MAG: HEAT repeat domain-containing protein [Gemmataceae bacterium]|nr:HEAT repeat domain-containing protein [Gemmataceae bacterium]